MITPNGSKPTSATEAFEAWKAHIGKIGARSPCVCGRTYVCQGCEACVKLAAAGARIEASDGPGS